MKSRSTIETYESLVLMSATAIDIDVQALTESTAEGDLLIGLTAEEQLAGGNGDDVIFGAAGDHLISGGTGNDLLIGLRGDNVIDGGDGTDTAVIVEGRRSDYQVTDLGFGGIVEISDGGNADLLIAVENVRFNDGVFSISDLLANNPAASAGFEATTAANIDTSQLNAGTAGNDFLAAVFVDESIDGAAGDDVIAALAGNNQLDGSEGNDTFVTQRGDNTIDGGSGEDRVLYLQHNRTDAKITDIGEGRILVETVDTTDVISNVEALAFRDQTVRVANIEFDAVDILPIEVPEEVEPPAAEELLVEEAPLPEESPAEEAVPEEAATEETEPTGDAEVAEPVDVIEVTETETTATQTEEVEPATQPEEEVIPPAPEPEEVISEDNPLTETPSEEVISIEEETTSESGASESSTPAAEGSAEETPLEKDETPSDPVSELPVEIVDVVEVIREEITVTTTGSDDNAPAEEATTSESTTETTSPEATDGAPAAPPEEENLSDQPGTESTNVEPPLEELPVALPVSDAASSSAVGDSSASSETDDSRPETNEKEEPTTNNGGSGTFLPTSTSAPSASENIADTGSAVTEEETLPQDTVAPVSAQSGVASTAGIWIAGTDGDDNIVGTDGDDEIHAPLGQNKIDGGGGVDSLIVYEGTAADFDVYREADGTVVLTGPGLNGETVRQEMTSVERILFNDRIVYTSEILADAEPAKTAAADVAPPAPASVNGTEQDDWIAAPEGDSQIDAGAGDDAIYAPHGNNEIDGGEGDDALIVYEGVYAEYQLQRLESGRIMLEGPGMNGTRVRSILKDVERIIFNDVEIATIDL